METYLEQISPTLTKQETQVIKDYVSYYQNITCMITMTITNVLNKNNKSQIDIHSIPQIILNIAQIFNSAQLQNEYKDPKNIILLIKFNLIYLLESKTIPMPEIEVEILEQIINSSLDLLSTNIIPIEEEITNLYDSYCNNLPNLPNLFSTCSCSTTEQCPSWFFRSSTDA